MSYHIVRFYFRKGRQRVVPLVLQMSTGVAENLGVLAGRLHPSLKKN